MKELSVHHQIAQDSTERHDLIVLPATETAVSWDGGRCKVRVQVHKMPGNWGPKRCWPLPGAGLLLTAWEHPMTATPVVDKAEPTWVQIPFQCWAFSFILFSLTWHPIFMQTTWTHPDTRCLLKTCDFVHLCQTFTLLFRDCHSHVFYETLYSPLCTL